MARLQNAQAHPAAANLEKILYLTDQIKPFCIK